MIELLRLKYFYFILYGFIFVASISINKIKADQEINLKADTITVKDNGQIVEAKGNALAIDEKNQTISSDIIIYNKVNDELTAKGRVVINDSNDNTYFIDRLISSNGIDDVKGLNVRARLDDDSRAVGKNLIKKDNISILNDAEYTPCSEKRYLINNCPGWKLKADKIIQDSASKTIHYDHATIELFNIPVLYLPYFSHPDPSVKKRSGLLMPTVETDERLGDTFSIPIFYNIKSNQDLTFTPNIQSNSNNFYFLNYRHLNKLGSFNLDSSIDDNDDKNGSSSHLFLNALINNPEGQLDAQIQTTNNDTYMRKNKINKLTVLKSGLSFQKDNSNSYLSIETKSFKHLTVQNSEQWEYVYPKIIYNINNIDGILSDSEIELNNELIVKKDIEENYTSLISSQANYKKNFINKSDGIVFNNNANFRVVSVSIDNKNTKDISNIRFYPQLSSKITYPLIKNSNKFNQTLTPIFMPIISPYNNYTSQQNITNSNLFSLNRASSITEWESGPRINYGIEWFGDNNHGSNIRVLLGQNFKFKKDSEDNTRDLSDYYLNSNISLSKNNFINNSFVIDRNDLDIRTINLNAFSEIENLKLAIDYDYTSGKYSLAKEQLAIGGEYNFGKDFFLKFTGSKNLDTNKNIGYQYGLLYENDCLGIDFNYYRDLTVDRDIEESDGFSFTIVLKPFGSTKNYGKIKTFGPQLN